MEGARFTFYYEVGKWGWSETFYKQTVADDMLEVVGRAYVAQRIKSMSAEVFCSAFRVFSINPNDRQTQLYTVTKDDGLGSMSGDNADVPWNCLLVRFKTDDPVPTQAPATNRYFRGFNDSAFAGPKESFNGIRESDPTIPKFKAFLAWMLTNGWGYGYVKILGGKFPGWIFKRTTGIFEAATLVRASHRQTGRPFDSPRGRAWANRAVR